MNKYSIGIILFLVGFLQFKSFASDTLKIKNNDHLMYGLHYAGLGDGLKPTILLLHGFPGGFDDVLNIGEKASSAGINVFTLTFSGVSISEGIYGDSSPIDDVNTAIDYFYTPENIIKYNIDTNQFLLGGWSFGGGVSMYVGAHNDRVKGIIPIAGFNGDAFLTQCEEQPEFKKFMEAVFISYRMRGVVNFNPMQAMDDLEKYRAYFTPVNFADKLAQKPMLMFGCTDDAEVSLVNHVMPYYQAIRSAGGKVRFHVYQTGHRFGGHRDQLSADIIDWIKE